MPRIEKSPKTLSLTVFTELRASHSLEGFETPHFHLWKVAVEFHHPHLMQDKLMDLLCLKHETDAILKPLQGTYLNQSLALMPTSENLSFWLWQQLETRFPTPGSLHSVSFTLCDLGGQALGTARVFQ